MGGTPLAGALLGSLAMCELDIRTMAAHRRWESPFIEKLET